MHTFVWMSSNYVLSEMLKSPNAFQCVVVEIVYEIKISSTSFYSFLVLIFIYIMKTTQRLAPFFMHFYNWIFFYLVGHLVCFRNR